MRKAGNAYPAENVEIFSDWYLSMMARINKTEWENKDVLHVRFEEFVKNFKTEKNRLDKFLGINEKTTSTYNAEKSKKNIGIFKNNLTNEEIDFLNKNLTMFI